MFYLSETIYLEIDDLLSTLYIKPRARMLRLVVLTLTTIYWNVPCWRRNMYLHQKWREVWWQKHRNTYPWTSSLGSAWGTLVPYPIPSRVNIERSNEGCLYLLLRGSLLHRDCGLKPNNLFSYTLAITYNNLSEASVPHLSITQRSKVFVFDCECSPFLSNCSM